MHEGIFLHKDNFSRRQFCTRVHFWTKKLFHEDTFARVEIYFVFSCCLFIFNFTLTPNPYPRSVFFCCNFFVLLLFIFYWLFYFLEFFWLIKFVRNIFFIIFSNTVTPNPYPRLVALFSIELVNFFFNFNLLSLFFLPHTLGQ